MSPEIAEIYGNRVRIRVCGLCWQDDSLLLIKHGMGPGGFWAPPGGGVELNEPLEVTLRREFLEETGLDVIPGKFIFQMLNCIDCIAGFGQFELNIACADFFVVADGKLHKVEPVIILQHIMRLL